MHSINQSNHKINYKINHKINYKANYKTETNHLQNFKFCFQNSFLAKTYKLIQDMRFMLLLIFFISGNTLYSNEQYRNEQEYNNKQEDTSPTIEKLFLSADEVKSHSDRCIALYSKLDPGYSKTFLSFNHFPVNKKITFDIYRLSNNITNETYLKHCDFFVDEDGIIIAIDDPMQMYPFFCISTRGFLPGERIFCRFTSEDGHLKKEISFIPNPMIAKNKSGTATVEAELITLIPTMYHFNFIGFQEGEKINMVSISGTEKLQGSFNFSKNVKIANSPDIRKKKGGIAQEIFIRSSGEKFQIELPWGSELIDYEKGNKMYKPN